MTKNFLKNKQYKVGVFPFIALCEERCFLNEQHTEWGYQLGNAEVYTYHKPVGNGAAAYQLGNTSSRTITDVKQR